MALLQRIPFALQVPIFTATLMIFVGFLASQQVLSTLRQVQDARMQELAQLQIEALSVALGPLVSRNDIWEVYDTLDRAAGQSEGQRLVFTAVANAEGVVLAATNPRRAPIDSRIGLVAKGAQTLNDLSVAGGIGEIKVLAPLIYQGRKVGLILTEMDVTDLVAERNHAARLLLLGNALATAILAMLGYLAMRKMLMPVTRVVERMQDSAEAPELISEADMPAGDSEMAQLVRSYNSMVGAIGAKAEVDRRLADRERFVSLGRLSSSLAHEINNPLGGLLNAADTARKYADRPEVVRESADLLIRGLGHLRDVARATLDMNRLDYEGTKLSDEDFQDLKLLILPEITHKQQHLGWKIDQADMAIELPAAPVRQIVLNLLLNAADAAGKQGRVALNAGFDNGQLRLEISDNGPGLSSAACERLLGVGEARSGGGVGLRLVRDLVGQLNGSINLDRVQDETVIRIELPIGVGAPC